jgi:hypothetical protein
MDSEFTSSALSLKWNTASMKKDVTATAAHTHCTRTRLTQPFIDRRIKTGCQSTRSSRNGFWYRQSMPCSLSFPFTASS